MNNDRELLQQALDALEYAEKHHGGDDCYADTIEAIRARLSQCDRCGEVNPAEIHTCSPQEQEPIAYLCENAVGHKYFRWKKPPSTYKPIALYTAHASPQRIWQGLTDEDWIIGKRSADYIAGAEWAEAKLKEKNSAT